VAEGTAQELTKKAQAETLDDAFIRLTGEELSDKESDVAETIAVGG
jgi:hypothetical protein